MKARGSGHIVNIASSAGKAGVPGIATYAATKHAVVGFTEAVRAECIDTGVDLSYVMPITVNTQLIEGLADKRGVKRVEPEDVADAIVDALELGKVDVYVPRELRVSVALGNLVPRRLREAIARFMGVTEVMTEVNPAARRAYEERISHNDPGVEPEAAGAPEKQEAA
jgi:short-subunit dehydrogenase